MESESLNFIRDETCSSVNVDCLLVFESMAGYNADYTVSKFN
jgi:hypothetical protein